jgi:hypothetical protein
LNDLNVEVKTSKETIRFPYKGSFDLKKTTSAIFPFNLSLGNTKLKSATVQPLTILNKSGKKYFVFYSLKGISPELLIEEGTKLGNFYNAQKDKNNGYTLVKGKDDEVFSFQSDNDEFLIIPYEMALNADKIGEQLIFSEGTVTNEGNQFSLVTRETDSNLDFYPKVSEDPTITFADLKQIKSKFHGFSSYIVSFKVPDPIINIKQVTNRKFSVTTSGDLGDLNDVFLQVDYIGDRGMAFIDGLLVTDEFYHEKKWEIGMKSFLPRLSNKNMVLIFYPLYSDQECVPYLPNIPDFKNGKFLDVKNIKAVNEYKAILDFN